MDILKDKQYAQYSYLSRYTGVPYYYNTEKEREIYGIGEQMLKDSPWVAHKVKPEDNLDALALNYYNNPTFWWVIAFFNNISDPFIRLSDHFDIIKIPSISSIVFGDLR